MRRISMQYAQPGMVLSMDVYDNFGNVILGQGTRLTFDNVAAIGRMGGGELYFEDRRVDDVPVTPLMPARLEGEAARKLHTLVDETAMALKNATGNQNINVNPVEKAVYSMVEQLFPVVIGEAKATGCSSLTDYNYVHPVQVTNLSILMGRKMGFKEAQLAELGIAALLENIGYVALPVGMMDEPTTLTGIEKHEVSQHTQYGYQILSDHSNLSPEIIMTILDHHERWDGSGFPRGIKGESISSYARILAITDTYYALVSRRPHRQSNLPHEAIEFIMAYAGELFDPELVRLFTKLIPLYPTGIMVNLNTGERGIISNTRLGFIGRPVVRICYDKELKELTKPYDMDLAESQHQHRLVTEVLEY
ncbi:MAG: HD domain-containing phosphohydrolase [Dehalococcoidales bacterium]